MEKEQRYFVIFEERPSVFSYCGIGGASREEAVQKMRERWATSDPRLTASAIGTAPAREGMASMLIKADSLGINVVDGFQRLDAPRDFGAIAILTRKRPAKVDPNAAMILRDGPPRYAAPKPAPEPVSTTKPALVGLLTEHQMGHRFGLGR